MKLIKREQNEDRVVEVLFLTAAIGGASCFLFWEEGNALSRRKEEGNDDKY